MEIVLIAGGAEEEEQEVYGREGQMDERRKRKDRA